MSLGADLEESAPPAGTETPAHLTEELLEAVDHIVEARDVLAQVIADADADYEPEADEAYVETDDDGEPVIVMPMAITAWPWLADARLAHDELDEWITAALAAASATDETSDAADELGVIWGGVAARAAWGAAVRFGPRAGRGVKSLANRTWRLVRGSKSKARAAAPGAAGAAATTASGAAAKRALPGLAKAMALLGAVALIGRPVGRGAAALGQGLLWLGGALLLGTTLTRTRRRN